MAGEQLVPWWYPGLAIGLIDYCTNYQLAEEDPVPVKPVTADPVYGVRPESDWSCHSCGEQIEVGEDFVLGPREGTTGLNFFHADCWEDYDDNK